MDGWMDGWMRAPMPPPTHYMPGSSTTSSVRTRVRAFVRNFSVFTNEIGRREASGPRSGGGGGLLAPTGRTKVDVGDGNAGPSL